MEEKYNLEYSEKFGFFCYANDSSSYSTIYKVICRNLSESNCNEFTLKMFDKYPNINTGRKPCPTFDTIKKEFELFLIS